jgi:hypothetical protein
MIYGYIGIKSRARLRIRYCFFFYPKHVEEGDSFE